MPALYLQVRDEHAAIILVFRQYNDCLHGYKHKRFRLVEFIPSKRCVSRYVALGKFVL